MELVVVVELDAGAQVGGGAWSSTDDVVPRSAVAHGQHGAHDGAEVGGGARSSQRRGAPEWATRLQMERGRGRRRESGRGAQADLTQPAAWSSTLSGFDPGNSLSALASVSETEGWQVKWQVEEWLHGQGRGTIHNRMVTHFSLRFGRVYVKLYG
jgi:hypothetical protein